MVEHVQDLAVGVVALERRHPDHDVGLLGGPVDDHEPLRRGRRGHALRPRPTQKHVPADLVSRLVEPAHHAFDDGAVLDSAGRGHHDVGRAVMLAVELGDLVARRGANGLLEPQDVPRPRGWPGYMAALNRSWTSSAGSSLCISISSTITCRSASSSSLRSAGPQMISERMSRPRSADSARSLHVKRRVLLGRERVHVAAHGIDELGDLAGAALSGPLEEQVLQEMRCPGDGFGLVDRTRADPEPQADREHVGHVLGDDRQAPVDDRRLHDVARGPSTASGARCL